MLTILCVDDDPIMHTHLKTLFEQSDTDVLAHFHNHAEELLFGLEDHKSVDAFFLDVEMDSMNGIDLAKKLRLLGHDQPIVFITGYTQYAIDGYDVQAYDYLLKPIKEDKFHKLLSALNAQKNIETHYIMLDVDDGSIKIDIDRIVGFEAQGSQVRMELIDGGHFLKLPLSQILSQLDSNFLQIHRSYIINIKAVEALQKDQITLSNGSVFPISRRLKAEVHRKVAHFYERGTYNL